MLCSVLSNKRHMNRWADGITAVLLWIWAWGVLAMAFGTRSGGGSALNLQLLDMTQPADVVDFALNMVMFLPAGTLLAARRTTFWAAAVVGASGSLCIEVAQYALATGRTADINDLVANTAGCVIGFGLWAGVRVLRQRRPRG